jgi:hypothetical protein
LNLNHGKSLPALALSIDESLWGVANSIKETNFFLVQSYELSLYCQIVMKHNDIKSPLRWWEKHEKQFAFVVYQILGFKLKLQIFLILSTY